MGAKISKKLFDCTENVYRTHFDDGEFNGTIYFL